MRFKKYLTTVKKIRNQIGEKDAPQQYQQQMSKD